ncbi:MAG: lysophospholipid acyltransferase family protein [Spirochaetota bacterium]
MSYTERIVNALVRGIMRVVCRLDARDVKRLPRRGPAILLANHTTNIEGPAYYVFIQPRPATALGKQELWKHWFTRIFMQLWGIIPVARGKVDRRALRAAVRALDEGRFLGSAPEGTRSKTGKLRRGQPGVAMLATMRSVPIYPLAHWGLLDLGRNLRRLRRTPVTLRLGRAFRVCVPDSVRPGAAELRQNTDEMMRELARALPEQYRGVYAEELDREPEFLEFLHEG